MSGLVGHSLYAVLGLKAAEQRRLPLAAVARRYFASYLAVEQRSTLLASLPADDPDWGTLRQSWKVKK